MPRSRSATIGRTPARVRGKAQTHREIVSAAGKIIRRKGLQAASVQEVMRRAGRTVGGFYAHFRSKTAMDAEVLRTTLAEVRAKLFSGLDRGRPNVWAKQLVTRYLAPTHRDLPSCPLPAVLSELSRSNPATRAALVEAFENYAREFETYAPVAPGVSPRERALATWAMCIGGLAISRAVKGSPLSDEVLNACAKWALPETRDPAGGVPSSFRKPSSRK